LQSATHVIISLSLHRWRGSVFIEVLYSVVASSGEVLFYSFFVRGVTRQSTGVYLPSVKLATSGKLTSFVSLLRFKYHVLRGVLRSFTKCLVLITDFVPKTTPNKFSVLSLILWSISIISL